MSLMNETGAMNPKSFLHLKYPRTEFMCIVYIGHAGPPPQLFRLFPTRVPDSLSCLVAYKQHFHRSLTQSLSVPLFDTAYKLVSAEFTPKLLEILLVLTFPPV